MGRCSLDKDTGTAKTLVKPHLVKFHQMLLGYEMRTEVLGMKAFTLPTAQISVHTQERQGVLVVAVFSDIPYSVFWGKEVIALKTEGLNAAPSASDRQESL